MVGALFGVFLLLHALIHLLWFVPLPDDPKWPFTTARSPLLPFLSERVLRPLAVVLVALIILGFAAATMGLFGVAGLTTVWGIAAVIASTLSIVACAVFWNRQLLLGPIIDIAIIAAALLGWPKAG